jgi:hypothetical protein
LTSLPAASTVFCGNKPPGYYPDLATGCQVRRNDVWMYSLLIIQKKKKEKEKSEKERKRERERERKRGILKRMVWAFIIFCLLPSD